MLTENDIKKAFMPFLREFYRFRYEYQSNTEQASTDNVSTEGWVADGMLRFVKPDGQTFACTFEATSADKTEEVKYTQNQDYFLWDCAAFAAFGAALAYAFLYIFDLTFLARLTTLGKIGMPMGLVLIGFFIWYFAMSGWKKYRYIFAIEQFKRYYADEQWVAIAEDVFPAPTNPYFLELKDQCIYHGIGLAVVYTDMQVRLMAAPSRLGVYGQNRRMAHWFTDTQLYQSMATNARAAAVYQSPVSGAFGKLRNTIMRPIDRYLVQPLRRALGVTLQPASSYYTRFTDGYPFQKTIVVSSLIMMTTFGVLSVKEKPVVEANRPSRLYDPEEKAPPPSPERQDGYVMNDREKAIPYGSTLKTGQNTGVPRQGETPAAYDEEEDETLYSQTPTLIIETNKKPQRATTPTVAPTTKTPAPANLCDRIKRAGGWYIQDNVFSTRAYALERAQQLRQKGIQCEVLNTACLGDDNWIVRLGYNQYTEAAARTKAADYAKQIEKSGLKTGRTIVKKI